MPYSDQIPIIIVLRTFQITFTPANHWSRRGLFDRNKVLWGSWAVVDDSGKSFWFAGDTAYADVFQQIGNKFGGFDLAAIPIGNEMFLALF